MKLILLVIGLIISMGLVDATFMNDQIIRLGNTSAYIIVNNTNFSIFSSFNETESPVNTIQFYINGSRINLTAGTNKTITNPSFNNLTDNFTTSVDGIAGYFNFSSLMLNASSNYNLTSNGAFVESRNTTTDKLVWFNYTGSYPTVLAITWNNTPSAIPSINSPSITSWSNNKTNDQSLTVVINVSEIIRFNATANQSIIQWNWSKDGTDQNNNLASINVSWDKSGRRNISMNGSNANGSTQFINWTVEVRSNIANRYDAINDSWVNSDLPNTNYGNDTTLHLKIVFCCVDYEPIFNFSQITGLNIQNATFNFYITSILSNDTTSFGRQEGAWKEATITYNTDAFGGSNPVSFNPKLGWNNIDITNIVQSWNNGSIAQYGITLGFADVSSDFYISSRKNINYNASYIQITLVPISNTPLITNVVNGSVGGTWGIINFTVNQSDALTQVKYSIDGSLSSATTNQTSGTDRSVNITGLQNSTTYNYSVFAYNLTNTSMWSNSSVQNFTTLGNPPNITSWSNSNSTNATLTLTVLRNTNITFNTTANQTLTSCSWTGATQINCTTDTYAFKNFTSAGIQTVSVYGTDTNGSTQIITWTITVQALGNFILSGYVQNTLGLPLNNSRIDINGVHVFTNGTGYYQITPLTESTYTTLARAIEYDNVTSSIVISGDTTANFTLTEKTWATQDDTNNSGMVGFVGGIIGGCLAVSVLRRYYRRG